MSSRPPSRLDQRWLIEHAGDRAPFICQSQSLNVFLPADVHKRDLHQIHFLAWKKGVKSLYYCRSKSIQRAESSQLGGTGRGHGGMPQGAASGPRPSQRHEDRLPVRRHLPRAGGR